MTSEKFKPPSNKPKAQKYTKYPRKHGKLQTSPKRSVQVTPSRLPSNVKQTNEKKKCIKILPKEFNKEFTKSRETLCDF